ncbi:hypothetical protein FHW79_005368 [Azospirillum sp. OGB3]|uniref:hypothetical protein n=1 Tax=Azospirillum sp. OGB3 TaxID=2587012 RepID=UPI001605B8EF|nr:hypothetical protein [Azospirillum sp. OGB3]MBB3267703.1 hypothetical protein [Azospirillum sp. OGB3]
MLDRKPLFVPLATSPYRWFESGTKTWELRRVGGQFQPKHLPAGRAATLSRGYSTPDRMRATVGRHVVGDHILDVLQAAGWKSVIPNATGPEEAIHLARQILGDKPGPFIGIEFKVSTCRGSADDLSA